MSKAVSIICPYRNAGAFLPGLISNVMQQTYKDWELLLIDDGSLDAGADIARQEARKDPRIRCITAPSRPSGSPLGPWWPRNIGLEIAKHDLVAFLDADDRWHPAKLERQLYWHGHGKASISVTGYARFKQTSNTIIGWRLPPPRFGYKRLRIGNAIPMLTLILERRLLSEGFQPYPHEDYLRWLALFREYPDLECVTIPELLGFYAVHDSNLTSQRWLMPLWAYGVYRVHGISRFSSCASLIRWGLCQAAAQWRSNRNPLKISVQLAQSSPTPWPLPPKRSG